MDYTIPLDYHPKLSLIDTEVAIKQIKDFFETKLAEQLQLLRVSAPLFVKDGIGINDDLNGIERPVVFDILSLSQNASVVQSLAKWKRLALKRYGIAPGHGLYTDMNAIRRDEVLDNIHSIYVDQWDWEKVILKEHRTTEFLQLTVRTIYQVMVETQTMICKLYPTLDHHFTESITFLTSTELKKRYPTLSSKEREDAICKEYGAVFISEIGGCLNDGSPAHDGRAPDYDDWKLNGDILIWYPPLQHAIELSSMGIRVDAASLLLQCELASCPSRLQFPFHQSLLRQELPLTMGGGIGQSRLCLVMLNKIHIGEVQASLWQDQVLSQYEEKGITLL